MANNANNSKYMFYNNNLFLKFFGGENLLKQEGKLFGHQKKIKIV